MKITIDTKEDSHEDIKKVIKMLQNLVGEDSYTNQHGIFEDSSSTPTESTNAFTSMFGDLSREPKDEPMGELKEEPEEEKEEIPEVVPY